MNDEQLTYLRQSIRTIADYPKPGIQFRDITTLLRDARAFEITIDAMIDPWRDRQIDKVAGIEARGFILGGAVARGLRCGFVPIRKRGKLPHETVRVAYSLEYGVDEMEMHTDAIRAGENVLLLDDLIATGGTATAAAKLLQSAGAQVCRRLLRHRPARPRRRRAPARRRHLRALTADVLNRDAAAHLRADRGRVAWRMVLGESRAAARSPGSPRAHARTARHRRGPARIPRASRSTPGRNSSPASSRTSPRPVTLVGHSRGGIVISRAAELAPERLRRLVYLSAYLVPAGGSLARVRAGRRRLAGAAQHDSGRGRGHLQPARGGDPRPRCLASARTPTTSSRWRA